MNLLNYITSKVNYFDFKEQIHVVYACKYALVKLQRFFNKTCIVYAKTF